MSLSYIRSKVKQWYKINSIHGKNVLKIQSIKSTHGIWHLVALVVRPSEGVLKIPGVESIKATRPPGRWPGPPSCPSPRYHGHLFQPRLSPYSLASSSPQIHKLGKILFLSSIGQIMFSHHSDQMPQTLQSLKDRSLKVYLYFPLPFCWSDYVL